MKFHFFALTILLSCALLAQDDHKNADWAPGVVKTFDGNAIYREEGTNKESEITNIKYTSAEQMIEEIEAKAKKQGWEKSKLKTEVERYSVHAKGGIIELYIQRAKMEEGNTSLYTIAITSLDGKEIQTKPLKTKQAKADQSGAYKNQGFMWIAEEIEHPFVVSVLFGADNKQVAKFQVK